MYELTGYVDFYYDGTGIYNKETFKDKNVITEDEFLQIINPLINKEE